MASYLDGTFLPYCGSTGQYVPYVMPQEHSQRTDVRWLSLTDGNGQGVVVAGRPTLEFSVSHFTTDDLFSTRHTIDLKPRAEMYLNLDYAHCRLGTASCGPDTLEQYRLRLVCAPSLCPNG